MKGVPSDHHLLYFGWLGNIKNLNWTINVHAPKSGGPTFPFPTNEHHMEDHDIYGTVLWGAYAYHIKKAGYDAIISALTLDVGGRATCSIFPHYHEMNVNLTIALKVYCGKENG